MEGEVIQSDIVAEAIRVTQAAVAEDVPLRLIGGLAIKLHSSQLPPALERTYADIDLVTTGKGSRRAVKFLAQLGYTPNDRFNALNAGRRAVVYDLQHQRQVDVFIGEFHMCHKIDLAGRLDVDRPTVPLAELLLTKLQIVQLNRKDLIDIAAMLYDHQVTDSDDDAVNGAYIAKVLSGDWGLWRTTRGTIESTQAHLADLGLDPAGERAVRGRLEQLWAMIEAAPKSLKWRSRARIGDRARWYEEPEEVDHDRTGERL
jgi:hypothetical protein